MTLRIDSIHVRGIGVLEDARLELTGCPGIVAISAPNGAGKSTLLECIPGAMYRRTPSRGQLKDIAKAKGASLVLRAHNGTPIEARHVIDATIKSIRQESVLMVDGTVTDGKVRSFDEAAASVFPPEQVFLATSFAAQGGVGDWTKLSTADLRQMFAHHLGLQRLQDIADAAKERRKEKLTEIATIEGRIADLKAGDMDALELELRRVQGEMVKDGPYMDLLRQRLDAARAEVAEAVAAERAVEEQRKMWQAQADRIARLHADVTATEGAIGRARAAAEALPEMEATLEAVARMTATIREFEPQVTEARMEKERAAREGSENWAALQQSLNDLSLLRDLLVRADDIRSAVVKAEELERRVNDLARVVSAIEDRVGEARTRVTAHKEAVSEAERLCVRLTYSERAASLLGEVPCGGEGQYAGCALLGDAARARDEVVKIRGDLVRAAWGFDLSSPTHLLSAEAELRAARDRLSTSSDDLRAARAASVDAPRLQDAEPMARKLEDEIVERTERHDVLIAARDRYASTLNRATAELDKARKDLASNAPGGEQQLRDSIASARAEAEKLDEHMGRLEALRQDLSVESETIGSEPTSQDAARRRREAQNQIAEAEADMARIKDRREGLIRRAATLEEQIRQGKEAREQRTELETQSARLRQDVADWTLVERGFGREGIQALLIDAAGPRISTLANELLQVTFGTRFRVNLETTRLDSTGKKLLESLELRVIDSERGREGAIETLSGGEKVVVGLALRLALILHGSQGSSQLFLDEMDGALDAENAERFVPMLRRGMELGAIDQVVFVSHRQECQDAADHLVRIEEGRVRMEVRP